MFMLGLAPPARAQKATLEGVVNINTASPEELRLLPGVGPARIRNILAYRHKHPFRTVEELARIKGHRSQDGAAPAPPLGGDRTHHGPEDHPPGLAGGIAARRSRAAGPSPATACARSTAPAAQGRARPSGDRQ
jgi:competence ComEA-like helix-hairpin-helix protein